MNALDAAEATVAALRSTDSRHARRTRGAMSSGCWWRSLGSSFGSWHAQLGGAGGKALAWPRMARAGRDATSAAAVTEFGDPGSGSARAELCLQAVEDGSELDRESRLQDPRTAEFRDPPVSRRHVSHLDVCRGTSVQHADLMRRTGRVDFAPALQMARVGRSPPPDTPVDTRAPQILVHRTPRLIPVCRIQGDRLLDPIGETPGEVRSDITYSKGTDQWALAL